MTRSPVRNSAALHHAFDEARFGPARTLDLRASLPTAAEAAERAEAWLREKQMSRSAEVLIITGRGNQSPDGVSVVRERVGQLLASLRRRGVVGAVTEHTPGSFAITLAPPTALRDAARRRREPIVPPRPADPATLAGLAVETRGLLRQVATISLEELGLRDPAPFVEQEMCAQFAALTAGAPEGSDTDARLRAALTAVLESYDRR